MNRSLHHIAGKVLVINQFILAADTSSGNRPEFSRAAKSVDGRKLYEYFVAKLKSLGTQV